MPLTLSSLFWSFFAIPWPEDPRPMLCGTRARGHHEDEDRCPWLTTRTTRHRPKTKKPGPGARCASRDSCLGGPLAGRSLEFTPGFCIHGLLVNNKSSIFGVWAAPGAPETIPKCGGGIKTTKGKLLGGFIPRAPAGLSRNIPEGIKPKNIKTT